jgi:hypothetical protein
MWLVDFSSAKGETGNSKGRLPSFLKGSVLINARSIDIALAAIMLSN